MSLCCEY